MRPFPMVSALLLEHGRAMMQTVMFALLKDFCGSINVVRNMTEDQMIDAAAMLLDECGNFRLEDYAMMFTMAKRGQLSINDGKGLMDRMDMEQLGKLIEVYWEKRNAAGNRAQDNPTPIAPTKTLAESPLVDPKRVFDFLKGVEQQLRDEGAGTQEEEDEVYRQEKIKYHQREQARQDAEQNQQSSTQS